MLPKDITSLRDGAGRQDNKTQTGCDLATNVAQWLVVVDCKEAKLG